MRLSPSQRGPKCPDCEQGFLVPFSRDEEFDYDVGEGSIKVIAKNVPVERCDSCGMVASGPAAAKVRHEAVCRAAGFLTPAEYKSIREAQGWSQQRLADLTGFGVATVSRAERGRLLPNRSYDKVLRAIRDCRDFREYLQGLLAPATESGTGGDPARPEQPEAMQAAGDRGTSGPVNRIKSRYSKPEEHTANAARSHRFNLCSCN